MKKAIVSDKAPKALGPYSAGVISGNNVFLSGQIGIDPAVGKLVEGIEAQAHQALTNLTNLLTAAEMTTDHVVKTTVLLADLADFAKVNEIYGQFFSEPYPARACFQVAALPAGALIEIEAIAKA